VATGIQSIYLGVITGWEGIGLFVIIIFGAMYLLRKAIREGFGAIIKHK
jgi:hypothetical protein